MNNPQIDGRTYGLRFAKPARVEEDVADLRLSGGWVAVKEKLSREGPAGLIMLDRKNATSGTVVKVGPSAAAEHGLKAGDRIFYTEWQGGRWSFRDAEADSRESRFLIMHADDVLAILED